MHWALAPDEALIIEFDAHDGLWMLTNMGVFFTSMDFLYRPVSYTPSRTTVDSDGKVRLVLAHDDPGCHNWMDTQGFERGNVTYRHMLEGDPAELRTRVVKRAELADALPADTATVTEEDRRCADVGSLQRDSAALRALMPRCSAGGGSESMPAATSAALVNAADCAPHAATSMMTFDCDGQHVLAGPGLRRRCRANTAWRADRPSCSGRRSSRRAMPDR